MSDRCNVFDHSNFETCCLKCSDSGFSAGSGTFYINFNGFEIENLTQQEQKNLGINYGVKINGISNPRFKRYENELKNAVVLAINGHKIANTESANEILSKLNDQQLRIDLITPRGERLRLIL